MSRVLTPLSCQVICEKADRTDIPTIDKKKYLVPSVRIPCLSYAMFCLINLTMPQGFDRGPVRLRNPEANQAGTRESYLHLRRRGSASNGSPHECHL